MNWPGLKKKHINNGPVKMRTFLVQAKKTAKIFAEKGEIVPNILLKHFDERYAELIAEGLDANPPPDRIAGDSGVRWKKHIREISLERLQAHQARNPTLSSWPSGPPSTTISQRETLECKKLKMKISGLFRSEEGAMAFSRIRSYVSTMQKNDLSCWLMV